MKKAVGVVLFLLIWYSLALIACNKILPLPTAVLYSLIYNYKSLAVHSAYSIFRLVSGVICALLVGWPLGVLFGYYKKTDKLVSPLIYIAAPIPKIALLPLIMLLFGIGNISKIFIIFIVMVFQIIVTVRDGVRKIPEECFLSCNAAKVSRVFIFLQILIPASLPQLCTSIRVGLATGISVLFFAESFGTEWGIGFYVMDMWMRLDYNQMYLGIITFGVVGLISTAALDEIEAMICPWQKGNTCIQ